MSFSYPILKLIKKVKDQIGEREEPVKLLSLGYPDLLLAPSHVEQIFGKGVAENLSFREDSERIIQWHSLKGQLDKIIDAQHFMELIGIELHSIDIVKDRGCERIVDLNEPLPEDMEGAYDIVLDGGTTEHCFNIGQAIKNVAMMVPEGGYVIQGNGLNNYNHGFYGLNPTCYYDFYTQNHFELIFFSGFSRRKTPIFPEMFQIPPVQGFLQLPELSGVLITARRQKVEPIVWPMQSKYLRARSAA